MDENFSRTSHRNPLAKIYKARNTKKSCSIHMQIWLQNGCSVQFSSVQFNLFDIIESYIQLRVNAYRHITINMYMYNQNENIIEKKIISLINSSDLIISVCFCGNPHLSTNTNREKALPPLPQKTFFQINNIRHVVLIPEVCYRDGTRQNTPKIMKIISLSIYDNNDLLY